jgi:hypothetical protein
MTNAEHEDRTKAENSQKQCTQEREEEEKKLKSLSEFQCRSMKFPRFENA